MNFQKNVSLKPFNTLGLDVQASIFYKWSEDAALPSLLDAAAVHKKVFWLGGGSNTVFLRDFDGLVIHIATRGIRHAVYDDNTVLITAAAGENWHNFVQYTLNHNWYGLENLSLIPGTVGAAPVQNIGAYGVEAKDTIRRVFGINTLSRKPFILTRDECRFSYRDSIFKHPSHQHCLITAVEFALSTHFNPHTAYGDIAQKAAELAGGKPLTARDIANAVISTRRAKLPDPGQLGSVGSFFHNPVVSAALAASILAQHPNAPHYPQADGRIKLAAGWLIEQAGLKSVTAGGMAVHDQQALVLVNRTHAVPQDVIRLKEIIQTTVFNRFGILLQPEPLFVE